MAVFSSTGNVICIPKYYTNCSKSDRTIRDFFDKPFLRAAGAASFHARVKRCTKCRAEFQSMELTRESD